MIFRDLIVAQIEAELHKLKACASLTEVAHRERLAVRALENIRHEDHRIHRYIRVLFMSHLRFMDETRGLLADDEVRRIVQAAEGILRDELSPGMGVLRILEERGEPRGPAWIGASRSRCWGTLDLEDDEN